MIVFCYDGTFEGLLSCLFDAYTMKCFPAGLLGPWDVPPLHASRVHQVATAEEKSGRVLAGLCKRLSASAMHMLLLGWLAEEPGIDLVMFRFMRKVFDGACGQEHNLADDNVLALTKLARQVSHEAHLMQGFVRFQKTAQGVYAAVIGPRYHVLPLIVAHFVERFADQHWLIYDEVRGQGVYFEEGRLQEATLDARLVQEGGLASHLLAEGEGLFEQAWRGYCTATVIKERLNPRLQRRCMPTRYWRYMTEKRPPKGGGER